MSQNEEINEKVPQHIEIKNAKFDPENYNQDAADKIREKYANRIPVLVWAVGKGIDTRKRKFIVPVDITVGQFLYVLKKQITNINSSDGIFLFIYDVNVMPASGDLIHKVYNEHNVTGFLRLTVMKENTFG